MSTLAAVVVLSLVLVLFTLWLTFNFYIVRLLVLLGYLDEQHNSVDVQRDGILGLLGRVGLNGRGSEKGVPSIKLQLQPIGVRVRGGLTLSQSSLALVSSYLVGVLPLQLTEIHVGEVNILLDCGFFKLLSSVLWHNADINLKTSVKVVGLLATAERTTIDDWKGKESKIEEGFFAESRYLADLLTSLVDRSFWEQGLPTSTSQRLDFALNNLSAHLECIHLRIRDNTGGRTGRRTTTRLQSSEPAEPEEICSRGRILGLRLGLVVLEPGQASEETSWATPRLLDIRAIDLYHDLAVPMTPTNSMRDPWSHLGLVPPDPREGNSTPSTEGIECHWAECVSQGEHSSVMSVTSLVLTLELPDLMCVMLAYGHRPCNRSKLLRLEVGQMCGVQVRLESTQMISLLGDTLEIITGGGPFFDWLEGVRLHWNSRLHSLRPMEADCQGYIEALGPQGGARNEATLASFENRMPLAQIMLLRMRARGWELPQQDHVANEAEWILKKLDPVLSRGSRNNGTYDNSGSWGNSDSSGESSGIDSSESESESDSDGSDDTSQEDDEANIHQLNRHQGLTADAEEAIRFRNLLYHAAQEWVSALSFMSPILEIGMSADITSALVLVFEQGKGRSRVAATSTFSGEIFGNTTQLHGMGDLKRDQMWLESGQQPEMTEEKHTEAESCTSPGGTLGDTIIERSFFRESKRSIDSHNWNKETMGASTHFVRRDHSIAQRQWSAVGRGERQPGQLMQSVSSHGPNMFDAAREPLGLLEVKAAMEEKARRGVLDLVAAVSVQELKLNFNMLMGVASPLPRDVDENRPMLSSNSLPQDMTPADSNEGSDQIQQESRPLVSEVGRRGPADEVVGMVSATEKRHQFSTAILPEREWLAIQVRPPYYLDGKVGLGADLRLESHGNEERSDGSNVLEIPCNPSMSVGLELASVRITDYGGLNNGVVFPTLVDAPVLGSGVVAVEEARARDGSVKEEESQVDGDQGRGKVVKVEFSMYSWGRIEAGVDVSRVTLTALPMRGLAILQTVLNCFTGDEVSRSEAELDTLEEEGLKLSEEDSEEEDSEEEGEGAGNGVGRVGKLVPEPPHAAYMWLGRIEARVSACLTEVHVVLVQDREDVTTNVLMMQVGEASAIANIKDTMESLTVDVKDMTLVPCVQSTGASRRISNTCRTLQEASVAVVLRLADPGTPGQLGRPSAPGVCFMREDSRGGEGGSRDENEVVNNVVGLLSEAGPLLELLDDVGAGLPVKDLELLPVTKQQIIAPVSVHIHYSTRAIKPGIQGGKDEGGKCGVGVASESSVLGAQTSTTQGAKRDSVTPELIENGEATSTGVVPPIANLGLGGIRENEVQNEVRDEIMETDVSVGVMMAEERGNGGDDFYGDVIVIIDKVVMPLDNSDEGRVIKGTGKKAKEVEESDHVRSSSVQVSVRVSDQKQTATIPLTQPITVSPASTPRPSTADTEVLAAPAPPSQTSSPWDKPRLVFKPVTRIQAAEVQVGIQMGGVTTGFVMAAVPGVWTRVGEPEVSPQAKKTLEVMGRDGKVMGIVQLFIEWRPRRLLVSVADARGITLPHGTTRLSIKGALKGKESFCCTRAVAIPPGSNVINLDEGMLFRCTEPHPVVILHALAGNGIESGPVGWDEEEGGKLSYGDASVSNTGAITDQDMSGGGSSQEVTLTEESGLGSGTLELATLELLLEDVKGCSLSYRSCVSPWGLDDEANSRSEEHGKENGATIIDMGSLRVAMTLVCTDSGGKVLPPPEGSEYLGLPLSCLNFPTRVAHTTPQDAGLQIGTNLELHISSGLRIQVTDVDLAVIKGIADTLLSPHLFNEEVTAPGAVGPDAGASSTAAAARNLGKEQLRAVARLRQAFREADVDGNGILDREEVDSMLRTHLEQQDLGPAEMEAQVAQLINVLDEDDSATLTINDFTSVMVRLVSRAADEQMLERARRAALRSAFQGADLDGSGTLDVAEITSLLERLETRQTQSELKREVSRFMQLADTDGSGTVDEDEFICLIDILRKGNPHEGPLDVQAGEYRSPIVTQALLEGFSSLPQLLAARPPTFFPNNFWAIMKSEMRATQQGVILEQAKGSLQAKMVKAFYNYRFAKDAWSLLVAPAWLPGLPRVGSITAHVYQAGNNIQKTSLFEGCMPISAPIREGTYIYSQGSTRWAQSKKGRDVSLSKMRILHLPKELSHQHHHHHHHHHRQYRKKWDSGGIWATGISVPSPGSLYQRVISLASLTFEVDRASTLYVCFHDTSDKVVGRGVSGRRVGGSLDVPDWAATQGLVNTDLVVETILPEKDGQHTFHKFLVYSCDVPPGPVSLGASGSGALPYLVFLRGLHHNHRRRSHHSSGHHHGGDSNRQSRRHSRGGQSNISAQDNDPLLPGVGTVARKGVVEVAGVGKGEHTKNMMTTGGGVGSRDGAITEQGQGEETWTNLSELMPSLGPCPSIAEEGPQISEPLPSHTDAAKHCPSSGAPEAIGETSKENIGPQAGVETGLPLTGGLGLGSLSQSGSMRSIRSAGTKTKQVRRGSVTSSKTTKPAKALSRNQDLGLLGWELSSRSKLGRAGEALAVLQREMESEARKTTNTALQVAAWAYSRKHHGGSGQQRWGSRKEGEVPPRLRVRAALLVQHGVRVVMGDILLLNLLGDHAPPRLDLAITMANWGRGGDGDREEARSTDLGKVTVCARRDCFGLYVEGEDVEGTEVGISKGKVMAESKLSSIGGASGSRLCPGCREERGLSTSGTPSWSFPAVTKEEGGSPGHLGLQASMHYEHVESSPILSTTDSLNIHGALGMEGKYFNALVKQSEHFLEPWSIGVSMKSSANKSGIHGDIRADDHLVVNLTTSFLTTVGFILNPLHNHGSSRYSALSAYAGLGREISPSRLLEIENRLGLEVNVYLESVPGYNAPEACKMGTSADRSNPGPSDPISSTIVPSRDPYGAHLGPLGGDVGGPGIAQVGIAELCIPDMSEVENMRLAVEIEGWEPVRGISLNFLSRRTQIFGLHRAEDSASGTWKEQGQNWKRGISAGHEGLVVKFTQKSSSDAGCLDVAMQLESNVFLQNDSAGILKTQLGSIMNPDPLISLSPGEGVSLPLPLLERGILRFLRYPSVAAAASGGMAASLVGEEGHEERRDGGEELVVELPVAAFDKKAKPGDRHTHSMLANCVSIKLEDTSSSDLVLRKEDKDSGGLALWSLVLRPPYVLHNSLPCEVWVEINQPEDGGTTIGEVWDGDRYRALSTGQQSGKKHKRFGSWRRSPLPFRSRSPMTTPHTPSSSRTSMEITIPQQPASKGGIKTSTAKFVDSSLQPPSPVPISHSTNGQVEGQSSSEDINSGDSVSSDSDSNESSSRTPPLILPGHVRGTSSSRGTARGASLGKLGFIDRIHRPRRQSKRSGFVDPQIAGQHGDVGKAHHIHSSSLRKVSADSNTLGHFSELSGEEGEDSEDSENSDVDNRNGTLTSTMDLTEAGTTQVGKGKHSPTLWLLRSGEEVKISWIDMRKAVHIRAGFPSVGDKGTKVIRKWCHPFVIPPDHHTNRKILNKLSAAEAEYDDGIGGRAPPEFKIGVRWEHTSGTRSIYLYAKVWVLNKTGVSLAYQSPGMRKQPENRRVGDGHSKAAKRMPKFPLYHTDEDALSFSRDTLSASKLDAPAGMEDSGHGQGLGKDNEERNRGEQVGERMEEMGEVEWVGNEKGEEEEVKAEPVVFGEMETLPLMLHCRSKMLQLMPLAMAYHAQDPPLYLGDPRSQSSESPLPCISFSGRRTRGHHRYSSSSSVLSKGSMDRVDVIGGRRSGTGGGKDYLEGRYQMYFDNPSLQVSLPKELTRPDRRRIHLLTCGKDGSMGNEFGRLMGGGGGDDPSEGYMSFIPSKDCIVYVGLDIRLANASVGPPKWLALLGYTRCTHLTATAVARPHDTAQCGFAIFRRFHRGMVKALLGPNVDAHGGCGDSITEGREQGVGGGKLPSAMYFVVVVEASAEEIATEVDVGHVVMHRNVKQQFYRSHRWRLNPAFSPGDPLYVDRGASYSVAALPHGARQGGAGLVQIVTSQSDKHCSGRSIASFQVFQRSRVVVCFDSRAHTPPKWLQSGGFEQVVGEFLPSVDIQKVTKSSDGKEGLRPVAVLTPPVPAKWGYNMFSKVVAAGTVVKLGGNKASGARRMYFCFVQADSVPFPSPGPSYVPSPVSGLLPPPLDGPEGEHDFVSTSPVPIPLPSPLPDSEAGSFGGCSESVVGRESVGSRLHKLLPRDHVAPFWDKASSGELVQAPLDLDNRGRGWCKAFSTDAVRSTGEAKAPAGVFGVTVSILPGTFHRTRVVTVWPRFILCNGLNCDVDVIPCMEDPDMKEKGDICWDTIRKHIQSVGSGASAALYDFLEVDEEEELEGDGKGENDKGGGKGKGQWNLFGEGRPNLQPCIRLVGPGGAVSEAVSLEAVHQESYIWLLRGAFEDVLVRCSCSLLGNGATLCLTLLDETMRPPLRVENRSSVHSLMYRVGGEGGEVVSLGPMRWNATSWHQEHERFIEVDHPDPNALAQGAIQDLPHSVSPSHLLLPRLSSGGRNIAGRSVDTTMWGKDSGSSGVGGMSIVNKNDVSDVSDVSEGGVQDQGIGEVKGTISKPHAVVDTKTFTGQRYAPDSIGRLPDLMFQNRVMLQAESLRHPEKISTVVIVFSDPKQEGGEGGVDTDASNHKHLHGVNGVDGGVYRANADPPGVRRIMSEMGLGVGEAQAMCLFAQIWENVEMKARLMGLVVNVAQSSLSGTTELLSLTVDHLEYGKPAGTQRSALSVWHIQLDDMRPGSQHPVILQPIETGFSSHIAETSDGRDVATPMLEVEVDRDVRVGLLHKMAVLRDVHTKISAMQCAVFVDYWMGLQEVVWASLDWTSAGPEVVRLQSVKEMNAMVQSKLHLLKEDVSASTIFIGAFSQSELMLAVDFHLGRKALAMLSKDSPDEEEEEVSMGASLSMVPASALGAVAWGLISSLGRSVANASPTFVFDSHTKVNYYGSTQRLIDSVVESLERQGIQQVYKVVGHIDILGDPLALTQNISGGVFRFVTKVGTGQAKEGTTALVQGIVGGAANSASKVAGALDHLVREAGALDEPFDSSSNWVNTHLEGGKGEERAVHHIGHGVAQGANYFLVTMAKGLKGVLAKPYKGAKEGGAVGFMRGVGKGVVGLAAAPVSGVLGATSKVTSGIEATTRLLGTQPMGRRRNPRHPRQVEDASEEGGVEELGLVPLTPEDMRSNLSHAYTRRFGLVAEVTGGAAGNVGEDAGWLREEMVAQERLKSGALSEDAGKVSSKSPTKLVSSPQGKDNDNEGLVGEGGMRNKLKRKLRRGHQSD